MPSKSAKLKLPPAWILALLGVVALASLAVIALLILRSSGMLGPLRPYVSPMPTRAPLPTETPAPPTITPVPTRAPRPTDTAIPTPTPGIGSTWTRPADGMVMVYVPAGEFSMGSNSNIDEQPIHTVKLDAFWIDRTEVTYAMYAKCVDAGVCQSTYYFYMDMQDADYPIVDVDWSQADAYCFWADARLPTEAEWEKAARGVDERTYPWGNDAPTCSLANYANCVGNTINVGSFPDGASPYGALDMAGNAWEWVNDWYAAYNANSPSFNPQGPASGQNRVLRGGACNYLEHNVRSSSRFRSPPTVAYYNYFGFRCSRSP